MKKITTDDIEAVVAYIRMDDGSIYRLDLLPTKLSADQTRLVLDAKFTNSIKTVRYSSEV